MQRILIIRFSSIGDIVLTSPVARVLQKKYPTADIRFVTKPAYTQLVKNSPYIKGVFTLNGGLNVLAEELKAFDPDLVVDLHHNLRTHILRTQIGGKWLAFKKLNVEKWLKVNLKVDRLPKQHIVERYLATLKPLGIEGDGKGLDLFFPADLSEPKIPSGFENGFMALVIRAKLVTKQLPKHKLSENVQTSILLYKGGVPIFHRGGGLIKHRFLPSHHASRIQEYRSHWSRKRCPPFGQCFQTFGKQNPETDKQNRGNGRTTGV